MRTFTENQEKAICGFLSENLMKPGFGPTPLSLKLLSMNAYSSQEIGEFRKEKFHASNSFLYGFENRWHISLRSPHLQRRCEIDEEYAKEFIERLNSCPQDYPPHRVFNFDETCWEIYNGPRRVLAEKGSESDKLIFSTGEK
jgi:hypothetical protein